METLLNRNITAEIEILGEWLSLGNAFKAMSQSCAEEVYQRHYLSGINICRVIGNGYTARFTGDYTIGDPACERLFSPETRFGIGSARETRLRIVKDGRETVLPVTITKIEETGGGINQPAKITVEFTSK